MPNAPERSSDDEGTGLLEALWRYKLLSVAIVVIFMTLGFLASLPGAGRYTGTVVVALKDPRGSIALQGSGVSSSDLPRYTRRRSDFANTQTSLQLAATYAHTDLDDVRDHVTVAPDPNTDAFRVVATARTRDEAVNLATSVARAYRALSKKALDEQSEQARGALDAEKQALLAIIDADPNGPKATAAASSMTQLDVQRAELAEAAALFGDGVDYIDQAKVQATGTSVVVRNVAIGAIFGLLVAALVAWFLASRRPWAYDADQVAQLIDAPFLGDVSAPGSVRRLGAALKGSHDGYELVSTTVSSLVSEGVVLMVSPTHALGRTETTLHAALSAAQKGRRVLLVDADNRRRELTQALGLSQSPGLVNVLRGTATLDEAARRILLDKVSVAGIGSGPQVDDSVSLYQSPSALQFLSTARSAFDLVIIDCAPLLDSAAASALARGADHVVLVVEAGTPLGVVKRASQQLSLLGLPVVGFVFARRHSSSASTHAVR